MIIEDDTAIGEELAFLLKNEGYHPFIVKDFTDISGQAQREHPDLILLDIGLPDKDGFSLCVSIKSSVNVPVIFVTSRDSSMDEVRALSMGETIILQNHTIFLCCWPELRLFFEERQGQMNLK